MVAESGGKWWRRSGEVWWRGAWQKVVAVVMAESGCERGGGEWWRRVVASGGGGEWWRVVMAERGGGAWWRSVVAGGSGGVLTINILYRKSILPITYTLDPPDPESQRHHGSRPDQQQ